jgi:hypothetical protein
VTSAALEQEIEGLIAALNDNHFRPNSDRTIALHGLEASQIRRLEAFTVAHRDMQCVLL